MAIVEVSIAPLGTGTTSISAYVADCHNVLRRAEGIKWQLTPMGTIIEGDLARIMEVILKMHEVPFEKGAVRVSTLIKIDDRRDKEATMLDKVQAVEDKIKGSPVP